MHWLETKTKWRNNLEDGEKVRICKEAFTCENYVVGK